MSSEPLYTDPSTQTPTHTTTPPPKTLTALARVFVQDRDTLKKAALGAYDIIRCRDPRWFVSDHHYYRLELIDWINCTALRIPCEPGPSLTARQYMFWYYGIGRLFHERELNNMTLSILFDRYGQALYNIGAAYETVGTVVRNMYDSGCIDTQSSFSREQQVYAEITRHNSSRKKPEDMLRSIASDHSAPDPERRTHALEEFFLREFQFDPHTGIVMSVTPEIPSVFAGFGLSRPPVPAVRRVTLVEFVAWNRVRICTTYPGLGYVGYSQALEHKARIASVEDTNIDSALEADTYRHVYKESLEFRALPAALVPRGSPDAAATQPPADTTASLVKVCIAARPGEAVPDLVAVVAALVSRGAPMPLHEIRGLCKNWDDFQRNHIRENKRCRYTYFRIGASQDGTIKNRPVSLSPDIVLDDVLRSHLASLLPH